MPKRDGVEVEGMGGSGWRRKRLLLKEPGACVGAKLVLRRASWHPTLLSRLGKIGNHRSGYLCVPEPLDHHWLQKSSTAFGKSSRRNLTANSGLSVSQACCFPWAALPALWAGLLPLTYLYNLHNPVASLLGPNRPFCFSFSSSVSGDLCIF